MNLNFEEISFTIIAYSGEAKSSAMNAINSAKKGNFEIAIELLEKAEQSMIIAEKAHMDVVSAEAGGEKFFFPVLFVHAEDQLLTTQTLMLLAREIVDLYRRIKTDIETPQRV